MSEEARRAKIPDVASMRDLVRRLRADADWLDGSEEETVELEREAASLIETLAEFLGSFGHDTREVR